MPFLRVLLTGVRTLFLQYLSQSILFIMRGDSRPCVLRNLVGLRLSWAYAFIRKYQYNQASIKAGIGQVGRVSANIPGDLGSIPGRVILKTLKMVLDNFLFNTQQYKVRIKRKVEQSRKRSSALPYPSVLKLLKREHSGPPRLCSPTLLLSFINQIFLSQFLNLIFSCLFVLFFIYPVHWSNRIHRLHLCRGVRTFQRVFCIWH